MFNQRYGYHRPIRNQRSHNFSTNFAPQVCLLIKMKICGMLWKPCLIADTAIAEPLATRVRLLRHLQLAMYTDVHNVRHKHHRVARFWVGRGDTGARQARAVYASAAYGRRRRTTHRINVITAKSRERGKKVTKATQARWTKRPGQAFNWAERMEVRGYLHKAGTYDQAVDNHSKNRGRHYRCAAAFDSDDLSGN